jgi:O-antigen/teichoic acid export membrane protein
MGGTVLTSAVPFLLLPVLTRHLTPAEFGTLAMFMVAVSLFDPLVGFSTAGAVSRRYFDRAELDFGNYVTNCLYVLAGTLVLLTAVLTLAGTALGRLLAVPGGWLWAALLISASRYLVSLVLVLWQVGQRPAWHTVLSFVQSAGILGVSVVFVVGFGWDWRGRVIGELATLLMLATFACVVLRRDRLLRGEPSPEHLRHSLRFGAGLVPHVYGALLIAATDRILISRMIGVDATGLYVVGAQIALIITLVERSFNMAWAPWLYERLKRDQPGDRVLITRITRGYNVVILSAAVGLGLMAPMVLGILVGPQYAGAGAYVLWLSIGAAFTGMYKMVVNPLFFYSRTELLAIVTFGVGGVNVLLSIVFIRLNGPVGAAQASALSLLLSYLLTARLAARVTAAERCAKVEALNATAA